MTISYNFITDHYLLIVANIVVYRTKDIKEIEEMIKRCGCDEYLAVNLKEVKEMVKRYKKNKKEIERYKKKQEVKKNGKSSVK